MVRRPGLKGIVRDRGAHGAAPVRTRRRERVEPGGDRESLAAAGHAGLARAEERLGAPVRVHGLRPPALGPVPARGCQDEPRILDQQRRGKGVHPGALASRQALSVVVEEPVDRGPLLRTAERGDCLGDRAIGLQQLAGPAGARPGAGLADQLDEHPLEVAPKDFVVAVRALVVDRNREDAAPLQLLEELPAALAAQQAVAQGAGKAAQDAGPDQELAEVLGELGHDVGGEVLAHDSRARPEAGKEALALPGRLAPRGEVEELEACRPSLGAARKAGQLVRAQRLAVEVAEETLHLPRSEAEVVARQLQ
jgi:hypothetical protein